MQTFPCLASSFNMRCSTQVRIVPPKFSFTRHAELYFLHQVLLNSTLLYVRLEAKVYLFKLKYTPQEFVPHSTAEDFLPRLNFISQSSVVSPRVEV